MNTILVIADHRGAKMTLGEFPVVFGRDQSATVLLTNVLASRQHCEITRTEEGLVLRDLGSVNGTLLNGVPVNEHVLRAGDQFIVGTSVFDVKLIGDASSEQSTRRRVLGSVAQILRSLGRERTSSADQMATVAADGATAQFN